MYKVSTKSKFLKNTGLRNLYLFAHLFIYSIYHLYFFALCIVIQLYNINQQNAPFLN